MSNIKQIIVIRKDLKMRRGKEIAQGSHASIAFITRRLQHEYQRLTGMVRPAIYRQGETLDCKLSEVELEWISEGFKKVCVTVNSAAELFELHQKAVTSGLESHLIVDNGLTEFNNVHTPTALAIGPDEDEKIDVITGALPLY